ncbi:basic salivary proline-rich protein 3-like [Phocoena sinus]|uniref:basic salivary proline-rich protein 3-like n=1 Tax=Phocoena sinus TaxID=42100 RepID=UPI0013C4A99E|nr:basic salivary proline-rich protein 3-like [Phocoena sinus]
MLVLDLTMSSSLSYDASSRKSSRMTRQEGAWTPTAPASGPYLATGLATVIWPWTLTSEPDALLGQRTHTATQLVLPGTGNAHQRPPMPRVLLETKQDTHGAKHPGSPPGLLLIRDNQCTVGHQRRHTPEMQELAGHTAHAAGPQVGRQSPALGKPRGPNAPSPECGAGEARRELGGNGWTAGSQRAGAPGLRGTSRRDPARPAHPPAPGTPPGPRPRNSQGGESHGPERSMPAPRGVPTVTPSLPVELVTAALTQLCLRVCMRCSRMSGE